MSDKEVEPINANEINDGLAKIGQKVLEKPDEEFYDFMNLLKMGIMDKINILRRDPVESFNMVNTNFLRIRVASTFSKSAFNYHKYWIHTLELIPPNYILSHKNDTIYLTIPYPLNHGVKSAKKIDA